MNLAGASTEDLSRGMTLAPPATFEATGRADVRLSLLSSAPRPLKDHARVHFHSYTMESVAEIVLYTGKELDPTIAKNARMGHPGFNSGRAQLLPGHEVFARLKLPAAVNSEFRIPNEE